MRNPKTTILGYIALVGSILTLVAKLLQTGRLGPEDLATLSTALSGLGLITAMDGGH